MCGDRLLPSHPPIPLSLALETDARLHLSGPAEAIFFFLPHRTTWCAFSHSSSLSFSRSLSPHLVVASLQCTASFKPDKPLTISSICCYLRQLFIYFTGETSIALRQQLRPTRKRATTRQHRWGFNVTPEMEAGALNPNEQEGKGERCFFCVQLSWKPGSLRVK